MQCDITVKAKPARPAAQKKKKQNTGTKTLTFTAPVTRQTVYKPSPPQIKGGGTSVRIRHRELLGNVIGSTSFAVVNTITMNPGLPGAFPWLSSQARGWEMYKFNALRLKYVTRTSTSTAGSILMSVDYDAVDAPPQDESTQATYEGTVEFAPWKDNVLQFNIGAMNRTLERHYLRHSAVLPAGIDIKTYDAAVVYISAVDFATNGAMAGKLWVEYDVTLFTPQLYQSTTASSTVKTNPASPPTNANPFGGVALSQGNQIMLPSGPAGGPYNVQLVNLVNGIEYALSYNLQNGTNLSLSHLDSSGPASMNTTSNVASSIAYSAFRTFVANGTYQNLAFFTDNAASTFGSGSSILLTPLASSAVV